MEIKTRRWLTHGSLFAVTFLTTTVAGSIYANNSLDALMTLRLDPIIHFLLRGWLFSVPLMAILVTHEMGHYLAGRRHYLDVTPPYFIPAPPPVGTFGAFIRIRSPIPDRQTLIEVGACGPVAGAVVAIPMLILGMALSEARPMVEPAKGIAFGSSIILELCSLIRFGHFTSDVSVALHPTALAAWFGLFVTAMNLLPIGQLDGGHVIYALFGPRWAKAISITVFALLIPCGLLFWPGWFVFALLTFFLGLRHPPPLNTYAPLTKTGYILGWCAIALFVLSFIPVPISMVE
jgi:membrane-associated protease RseP (regulator of RpoE activity)